MIRRTLVATLAALALLAGMTVSTALAARPVWVFSTQLTGEAEVPVTGDLDAVGHATILIRPATDTICWAVTWARVDTSEDGVVFAAHIHGRAPVGEPAGVVVPLFVGATYAGQGSDRGCTTHPDAGLIAEMPELYYVNVHSSAFPGGAVRGQLA